MKSSKIFANLLVLLLLAGVAAVPQSLAAGTINIKVVPPENIFDTGTTPVGTEFTVDVVLQGITPEDDLVGIEFKFYWDPTMLEGMKIDIPPDSIWAEAEDDGNLWVVKKSIDKTAGYAHYIVTCSDIALGYEHGYLPLDEIPSGIAARVTLKIIASAPRYGELSCTLDLVDTKLANGLAEPIVHTSTPGLYTYTWSAPPRPYLSVDPAEVRFTASPPPAPYTPEFSIDVCMNNLDAEWHMVGVEFKLRYDTTLLEVKNVVEGPFMASFGATWFVTHIEYDYVYVMITFWPIDKTNPVTYPEGSGVLATITFQGIYAEEFPWEASCVLDLTDVKLSDEKAYPVPYDAEKEVDGLYIIKGYTIGRMVDVFTQYPDGFNGKGPNEPSDMFWPQKEVILYANATYNLWPEQNKDVAFQIIDPYGETWAIYSNKTDETGIAWVKFRLPWPCEDPEYWFGEWTVVATVDIACIIVNDTLTFHYDYLVHIWKVTTDKTEYAHCEFIEVTIEYGTHAMQDYDVVITLTANDETGVPFGFTYVRLTVGGATYCHYKNDTANLSVHVVKWARAGVAKLYVCALSDFPFSGGYAIYDYEPVEVTILAKWAQAT